MRLLKLSSRGKLSLTEDLVDNVPSYAILSHTWGADNDEVTFADLQNGTYRRKLGYLKIQFCGEQARKDGINHFWVDTCCINKANHAELSEAITSMFRWYRDAVKCYVYLADVSARKRKHNSDGQTQYAWEADFRISRWFTRGWTLQELLAPKSVEFFSREQECLGDKSTLVQQIHEITRIPVDALRGTPLSHFLPAEKLRWAAKRQTKRKEDQAYCLLGIFDLFIPLIYGEGENAFVRLQDEISKRSGSAEKTAHTHWLVPRSANPLFTGREDLLQELESIVRDAVRDPLGGPQCRIVISGMGGQGKSEICLQLARRLRHIFWAVLWIDVSTEDIAERAFLDVAAKLSIQAQTWDDARLGVANLKHPWFLVLDNADLIEIDYQNYFPDGASGVVILTSRNNECQVHTTTKRIVLEGLRDNEALELLLKAACVPQDQHSVHEDDARIVASLLQSHALALIQAGAYVSRGHCTLAAYPSVYERQRRRLLAYRPTQAQSRYRDVYTTFEVSVDTLKTTKTEAARDALQLLPLLATCSPSRLPLFLFEGGWKGARLVPLDLDDNAEDDEVMLLTPWHAARTPPFINTVSDVWDSFRLVEALSLLKAFSLVSTDSHGGCLRVSLHALVHAWARDRQDDGEQHRNWLRMGCVTALALRQERLSQEHKRWLQPHIEALIEWNFAKVFVSELPILILRILMRCGWYLLNMRADVKLLILIDRIFIRLGLDRLKVNRLYIGLYDLAARCLLRYGKVREAVQLLEEVVKIREQSLAEDHPLRLASQHELAGAYQAYGQVKDAVALLEKVVKIQGQSLAEDHPLRLASQHELARAYKANGQVKDAVALLEAVVKIRDQSLAEDHPDRLASQHILAGAYEANGQVKEAVALLEAVVKIEEQSLAEDHPSRLASQHALAGAYEANGQVKEAVALLEAVVKIEEQSLAEDHPSRLASQHNLATYLWKLGEHRTSLNMMAQVVELYRQTVNKNHPDRQNSEDWLATMEDEMEELKMDQSSDSS